jgi:membrane-anchored protein YejM (alkaline phosphatase superfamily)
MPDVAASRWPVALRERVVRFIALVLLLQAATLIASSRFMIRNIRADGGTPVEFLFFAVYAVVLLLGVGTATFLLCALAHRFFAERGERLTAIALATLANTLLGADIITFSLLGVHPYGTAMWAGVASGDVKQFGGGTLLAALALVWVSLLISVALWVASGRFGLGERSARLAHVLPRRMALYFVIGTIAFVALDQPDEERVVPREALPYYALWLGLGNRYPDARPAFAALPAPPPPVFTRRPDIVMVLVESLRSDAMTPEVMPYLSQLAARPGCAAGERHYAGGHLTQYGSFALLDGMASYAFLPFMKQQRQSEPLAARRAAR